MEENNELLLGLLISLKEQISGLESLAITNDQLGEYSRIDISKIIDSFFANESSMLSSIAWENAQKNQNSACENCSSDGKCKGCSASDISTLFQLELDSVQSLTDNMEVEKLLDIIFEVIDKLLLSKVVIKILSEENKYVLPFLSKYIENDFFKNLDMKNKINISNMIKIKDVYLMNFNNPIFRINSEKSDYVSLGEDLILFIEKSG